MEIILIFIWGTLGGFLRLGITDLINYHVFPLATLIVNLIGAFSLPFWNNYLGKRLNIPSMVVRSFGTGFIGSFTTFSGIMIDSFKLIEANQIFSLIIYFGLSLILGIALSIYGNQLANKLKRKELGWWLA